jgi:hypothetical protein
LGSNATSAQIGQITVNTLHELHPRAMYALPPNACKRDNASNLRGFHPV